MYKVSFNILFLRSVSEVPIIFKNNFSAIYTRQDNEFGAHMSHAALMFVISSGLSFLIYLFTFQQAKRKQLRDCSLILLGAFMLLGISLKEGVSVLFS